MIPGQLILLQMVLSLYFLVEEGYESTANALVYGSGLVAKLAYTFPVVS